MVVFRYAPEIVARFPGLRGGVVLARDLRGGPAPPGLERAYRDEQRAVLARLGDRPLAGIPSLAAWRRAFAAFGVKPTQYRCAAEALLRRLTKKGDIPGLNRLVDLGNLVSIRYALPVAVLDRRHVAGAITVRFARGDEPFTELGSDVVRRPEPGEVIFVDEAGTVHARRWCWRQGARSAAGEGTTDALVTVEAHHHGAGEDVAAAVADLEALLAEFAGGRCASAVLSPDTPAFAPG